MSLTSRPSRRRLSLTVKVSALLVLAVVLPLIVTVVGSELILRPTLMSEAETAMGNDAQAHVQAIDSLFVARMQDIGFLGQYLAIQRYLEGQDIYKQQALNELALGYRLDPNYSTWTLFDTQGKIRLSYPANPGTRGDLLVDPDIVQQLNGANRTRISNVYFDDAMHVAFVDIYTSITTPDGTLLGYGRSTLKLTDIWTAINNETNAAPGSYAMILDNNGVRIAYTNADTTLSTLPSQLFKSVAPLSAQLQQKIESENLYGNAHSPVAELSDPALVNTQSAATFQFTPASQTEPFQAYLVPFQIVPWSYIVLRPVSTIIGAANQQDIYLILIAGLIMLLAAIVGLFVGRGITRPILTSVASLRQNSQSLRELASREQVTSTEQRWIVETAQTGLKSVEYYAEATGIAARRLETMGRDLLRNWERLEPWQAKERIDQIRATANYIENAANHQERSSKSLSTAINVTMQVTDQLVRASTSAAESSAQLEGISEQLRQVVGE